MSSLQVHMEREAREHKQRPAHADIMTETTRDKEILAYVDHALGTPDTPTRNPAHRADTGDAA